MIEVDSRQQLYEVKDLDAAALLDFARDADVLARAAERRKLRLVLKWCHLHVVADPDEAATWGDGQRGSMADCDLTLGGEGTPLVAAGIAEPLGAALGVSTQSGMSWMSDALDLAYRFPRLSAQVEDLSLPVWKARRVAQDTAAFSMSACAFVDEQLAARARGFGLVTIDRIVAIAIARFHPELLDEAEKVGKASWDVTLEHPLPSRFDGTSHIAATGDTVALTRFHELVSTVAIALGKLGDEDPLKVRKAKALGIIADTEALIELLTRAEQLAPGGSSGLSRKPGKVKAYAHISAAALDTLAVATGETLVIGEVERLGPATVAKICEWLDISGATITPVIDLNRTDAVDAHDPPQWMRELVILRDQHCVFPWCATDARSCDLDHIEPYVHGTDGNRAPPDQTRPENLAPLCRSHHRAKTFRGWTYRRLPDGSYRWRDPYGNTYVVSKDGTHDLHDR